MKANPKVGTTAEGRFIVEPRHVIEFADGSVPAALCTPWLVWFLEHAARRAMRRLLETGESTVGAHMRCVTWARHPWVGPSFVVPASSTPMEQ